MQYSSCSEVQACRSINLNELVFVDLAMKGLLQVDCCRVRLARLSFVRTVPKLFLSAGGGAAGKVDNSCRYAETLSCKDQGLSFQDLESSRT